MTSEGENPDGTAPGINPAAEPVSPVTPEADQPGGVPPDGPEFDTETEQVSPEDERAFLEETRALDSPADYNLTKVKILDSEDPDQFREALGVAANLAHRMKLNQSETDEITNAYNASVADPDFDTDEANDQRYEDGAATLKKLWGDDWEFHLDVVKTFLNLDPEAKAFINKSGLGNDPRVIRALFDAAKRFGTDFNTTARARLGE